MPCTSDHTDGCVTAHGGSKNVIFSFYFFVYRVEYLEKSKHLQDQLRELRSEIEVLKVGEKQSELDQLHDEQVRLGETKYSTLRKVSVFLCIWSCE
jgi:Ezrin/radixin/moesin family.